MRLAYGRVKADVAQYTTLEGWGLMVSTEANRGGQQCSIGLPELNAGVTMRCWCQPARGGRSKPVAAAQVRATNGAIQRSETWDPAMWLMQVVTEPGAAGLMR